MSCLLLLRTLNLYSFDCAKLSVALIRTRARPSGNTGPKLRCAFIDFFKVRRRNNRWKRLKFAKVQPAGRLDLSMPTLRGLNFTIFSLRCSQRSDYEIQFAGKYRAESLGVVSRHHDLWRSILQHRGRRPAGCRRHGRE